MRRTPGWPVWALTFTRCAVEGLCISASWYGFRTLTPACAGIEPLVSRTLDHFWALALARACVENLGRGGTFVGTVWTLTLAGVGIETLGACTECDGRAFALTGICIKFLRWMAISPCKANTITNPEAELLASWAGLVAALASAPVVVEVISTWTGTISAMAV